MRLTSYDVGVLLTATIREQNPTATVTVGRVRAAGFTGYDADLTVTLMGVSTPVRATYTDPTPLSAARIDFEVAA